MNKKYIVRLTAKERRVLREVVKKLNGSSQKVRRAQMLLKADVSGPAWTDEQIAEAFESRTRTVEKLRERFVTEGRSYDGPGIAPDVPVSSFTPEGLASGRDAGIEAALARLAEK